MPKNGTDYLMDPQPWNPVCNRYLVKLNDSAKALNVTDDVSSAYYIYNTEVDKSKEKLLKRLKSLMGTKWDEVIAD
jgi:hypothetical protein